MNVWERRERERERERPKGKRSLERPSRRWNDTIRVYLIEVRQEGVKFIHLAQDTDQ